jgi:acetylornithine deacetylase/succinyl-diaminopimelate desuccinylase-like protein
MKSALLLVGMLLSACLTAQTTSNPLLDLKVDVVYLSSDLLEGRETGKKGESMAAEYIAHRFAEAGLKPMGNAGKWYQEFTVNYRPHPHAETSEERQAKNVVGYLDNGAEHTVVIGAHYDHLGHGFMGSRHTGEPDIHNGADDNASGVAGLFNLAAALQNSYAKNNNYLFIAFSGEEMGLLGSKYFVKNPTINLSKVNYMLNMDMVGRLNSEKVLVINGVGTSPAWKTVIGELNIAGIQTKTTDSGIGASDHTSFYLEGIPAVHFFTGQHSDYHKPADDAELVNYPGLLDVCNYMLAMIETMDSMEKIGFTKTKDENEGRKASKFKVTLGVMPDYVYQGEGMRIDGIIDGRPGAAAGLEDGDIIIKVGDVEVKDIYGYMEGLGKFNAGDKTIIVVKRGDQVIEKEVQF